MVKLILINGIIFSGLANLILTKSIYKKIMGLQISVLGCLLLCSRMTGAIGGSFEEVLLTIFVMMVEVILSILALFFLRKATDNKVTMSSDDIFGNEEAN